MQGPAVDEDVTGRELDRSVVRELSTLRAEAAEQAAKHLVMAARLMGESPDLAYEHAMAARRCGPRVGVIREAVGIAAYHAEKWTEALAELRAARRISGGVEHWPMMADCERALGRPERTLAMASAPEAAELDRAGVVEMRIVVAGARADMGQLDAAVVTLQTPDLQGPEGAQWVARLRCAYAAALEAVGRSEEARTWYERAAAADPEGETGAGDRLAELDGVVFYDDEDEDDEALEEEAAAESRGHAHEPGGSQGFDPAEAAAARSRAREEFGGEGSDDGSVDELAADVSHDHEEALDRHDLAEHADEPGDRDARVDRERSDAVRSDEARNAPSDANEDAGADDADADVAADLDADPEAAADADVTADLADADADEDAEAEAGADLAADADVAADDDADRSDVSDAQNRGTTEASRRSAAAPLASNVDAADLPSAGPESGEDEGRQETKVEPPSAAPARRPAVTTQLFLEAPGGAQLEFEDDDDE